MLLYALPMVHRSFAKPHSSVQTTLSARGITPAVIAGLSLIIGLSGCVAPKPPPAIAPGDFEGPAVSLSRSAQAGSVAPTHVVVVDLPSPGWTPTLDQTRPAFRSSEAYITLREPNPAFVFPQVITPVRIGTPIDASETIHVFIRTLPYGTKLDADDPGTYRRARIESVVDAGRAR
jgi:hypothetical protein